MARVFAGSLAMLAFILCLARGIVQQADPMAVLSSAFYALWAFAGIGLAAGLIAERIVRESFEARPRETVENGEQPNNAVPAATE